MSETAKPTSTPGRPQSTTAGGLAFAVSANTIWGAMPLYFTWLIPSGPYEIVAWRLLFSLAFCLGLLTIVRRWRSLAALIRDRHAMAWFALAAVLVTMNWTLYVYAAVNGHVIEAALGYFINPIVSVLLGVVFLRERLRPLQWAAVGVATIAVVVMTIALGSPPWLALLISITFGLYGLVKNRVGQRIDAISGFTVETAMLSPFAVVALLLISQHWAPLDPTGIGISLGQLGVVHTVTLLFAGVITAVPLLLFAAAAARIPLSLLGLSQFIGPILQFFVGVVILQEAMPAARWIGSAIIWIAAALIVVDMLAQVAKRPLARAG